MMKKILLAGIVMSMITISSCDEDTAGIGSSLTDTGDLFTIVTDTFDVSSKSIKIDSVLSRSSYSYLGRIKDPETGTYITCDYMTQFAVLENEQDFLFPEESAILGKDNNGKAVADSCILSVIVDNWMGDSLAAMKMTVYELDKPVEEGTMYYTDFSPVKSGYVRTDGLKQSKVFSIVDLQMSDSLRKVRQSGSYLDYISIPLKQSYTDKEGNSYNNYGTYLLRNYYSHPEYFKNSYQFIHHLCPGFYFEISDGLGLMTQVYTTQLTIFYHYELDGTTYVGTKILNGTEEVLQTTHISNDQAQIESLVSRTDCTYLKTPAGIFTEVTLPVDDIKYQHESDTITSARIVFNRMNDQNELSNSILKEPESLLMIERDSLYTFFENHHLTDNITSYLATYSSTNNTYTYNNISALINYMYNTKKAGGANYEAEHPNWNKVVLVPVETVTTTTQTSYYYSSTTTVTGINNEMSMTSVRLVGGSNNQHAPIKISVIYNKTE